jgi:2-phosphoglycerate kinase
MKQEELEDAFPSSYQRGKDNDERYSIYSSGEIIEAYRKQAKITYEAVDMFCICEITDGNDFIIEGYHIEPELVSKLSEKYPGKIQGIFLGKTDTSKFVENIKKSSTANDWIIAKTKDEATYIKIADMICEYSRIFESEAKKYNFDFMNMDYAFEEKIQKIIELLSKK